MKNTALLLQVLLALTCFAANSFLARSALLEYKVNPLLFTSVRLLSGGIFLIPILLFKRNYQEISWVKGLKGSFVLIIYALLFSLSYIKLDTGLGALILFGCVQISIFGLSLIKKTFFQRQDYIGVIVCLTGLGVLFIPGSALRITFFDALLMAGSGLAWGSYCLIGADSKRPILDNASSFALTIPLSIIGLFFTWPDYLGTGLTLAVISGSITSALAYSLWYHVSSKLKISEVAISQTTVPIIATVMGVSFLGEQVHLNFVLASLLVLAGILIKSLKKTNLEKGNTNE